MRLGNTRLTAVALIAPLLVGLTVAATTGLAAERGDGLQAALVDWASGESVERLSRSSHKADFFPLSNHFISQDNSIFCGPVSSAIVLNALRLGRQEGLPRDRSSIADDEMAWLWKGADPFYGKYTPNNVLNERTKTRIEVLGKPILIDGEPKRDYGLQLHQLAQVHHFAAGRSREQSPGLHMRKIDHEVRRAGGAVLDLHAQQRGLGAAVEQAVEGLAVVDDGAGLGTQANDGILPPDRDVAGGRIVEAGPEPRRVGPPVRGPVERHAGEHVGADASKAGHPPNSHTDRTIHTPSPPSAWTDGCGVYSRCQLFRTAKTLSSWR